MLVIAHRGASADAPENTPAAFVLAETQGADGIELDVRHAADGTLVVTHDPLSPATDSDAAGHVDLRSALASMRTDTLVNVEIKNLASDGGSDPTMAVLEPVLAELRAAGAPERWLVSSFSAATIDACCEMAPEIAVALLVGRIGADRLARAARRGYAAVHPHESTIDAAVVERCHAAGLAVIAWTVNDVGRMAELADLGVDGLFTDVPGVARDAIGSAPTAVSWPRWETPA
ncbi:MAG: glycerophosphodiester phosphodiesterase [Actinomycetota bacterium]